MTVLCGYVELHGPGQDPPGDDEIHDAHELVHVLPRREPGHEIVADDEARLPVDAVARNEARDGIDGIRRPAALDFPGIDDESIVARHGEAQHCKAVLRGEHRRRVLVHGLVGGHEYRRVVAEGGADLLRDEQMAVVHGVECSAQDDRLHPAVSRRRGGPAHELPYRREKLRQAVPREGGDADERLAGECRGKILHARGSLREVELRADEDPRPARKRRRE